MALYARIIGSEHRAATHAPMQPPGTPGGKYLTVHAEITDDQIAAHIAGTETYAVKLIGRDGFARAWTIDVDEGGTAAVRAHVEALRAAGLPCLGIAGQGAGEHDGGHIWGIYAAPVTPTDAKAQIKATLDNAGLPTKEIWPCGIHIRAPFGVHTHTGRRGTLIRPDVPDVCLDTPEGLALGLDTLAGLKPTPTPPPLPPPTPRPTATTILSAGEAGGGVRDVIKAFNREHPIDQLLRSYGAQHTRDGWACNCGVAHTHETQIAVTSGGNAIFFSARCAWATTRTDRNGRPVADSFDLFTIVEHHGDKSAALRALRGKQPRPSDAERQRASRERQQQRLSEAQALIRDRAAEDAELVSRPTVRAVLAALLDGSCLWNSDLVSSLSNLRLQEALGKSERTIQYATKWLEGRYVVSKMRGPKDTTLRIFIKTPRISVTSAQSPDLTIRTPQNDDFRGATDTQNSVTSEEMPVNGVVVPQSNPSRGATDAANSVTSEQAHDLTIRTPQTPVSRGAISEVQNGTLHPSTDMTGEGGASSVRANAQAWETWEYAPDVGDGYGIDDAPSSPACPAPAATTVVIPTVTTPEPVVTPVHHALTLGVDLTESQRLSDQLAVLRARYVAEVLLAAPAAPEQCVPTAPERPSPAPETTTAVEVIAPVVIVAQTPVQTAPRAEMSVIAVVVELIEVARTDIKRTMVATKRRVRDILSDVPPELFNAAWKKANDRWGNYRADLEQCDPIALAFAVRDTARKHANAVSKDSPSVNYYAAQSRIAAEICARRGIDPLDPTGKKKLRATQARAKAQAKGQTERRGKVASLFVSSVAQAPLFGYHQPACAD